MSRLWRAPVWRLSALLPLLLLLLVPLSPWLASTCLAGGVAVPVLGGSLVDLTRNHGADRRFYSSALGEKRDMYVYLPPGYDRRKRYPLLIWLHGYMADERQSLYTVLPALDEAIRRGDLPPLVAAIPDGSISGDFYYVGVGSWWIDSRRGRFQTYVLEDVIRFMERNFSVTRDPSRRILAGWSMGGFGAYNMVLKYPDRFRIVAAVSPPLNLRYVDCTGNYFGDFDPNCWHMRDHFTGLDVVGRYWHGLVKVRAWWVIYPVWGRGRAAVRRIIQENPLDILVRRRPDLRHNRLFVAYGRCDEMNLDAQIESFLYVASRMGVKVEAVAYPDGTHVESFMASVVYNLLQWVGSQLDRVPVMGGERLGQRHQQALPPPGRRRPSAAPAAASYNTGE